MLYKKIFVCAVLFMIFADSSYGTDAVLVNQPAYSSMSFYVYRPANIPDEFYATYDGYLVYKDVNGIWNYASSEKSGIKKTGYVVGSVIPSIVKLRAYDTKISSINPVFDPVLRNEPLTIKPAGTRIAPDEIISLELDTPEVLRIDVTPITKPETKKEYPIAVYEPPAANALIYDSVSLTPNAAEWTQNSNFMAIGKWQNSVDRIGVLDKPRTPIAWKGDYPEIIYVWTGMQWRQIHARSKHTSALNTIRRENYNLVVHTNKLNTLSWNDKDTYVLSQYTMRWGYQWLGQLLINRGD